MAAKRISASSINWTAFGERISKSNLPNYQALKARNEAYVRRVAAYPDSLPKIDWNYYKSKITVPGMVDSFQKSYESLSVPYPSDQGLIEKINEQEKQMKKEVLEYSAKADSLIENLQKELKTLEAEIPFSEMTMEEYYLTNTHDAIDPVNNPTLFPHDEESREFTRQLKASGKL